MLALKFLDRQIDCALSSDPGLVELFSHLLQETLVYKNVEIASGLSLVARELLMNAAIHGNKRDAEKKIEFTLDMENSRHCTIKVKDEGNGFDYTRLDMSMPADPRHGRSRGYSIIRSHASRIEFYDNGSRVVVHLETCASGIV